MTNTDPHIEQLRQELLKQDPSLSSQKKEYIGLITRMSSHIPEVQIDKNFQEHLKSRLEYHIQHTVTHPLVSPQTKISRRNRLLRYGIPTIAIGAIIFLALPGTPNQVIAPTDTYIIDASSGELIRVDSTSLTTDTQTNSNKTNTTDNTISNGDNTKESNARLMMEDITPTTSQDPNSSTSSDIQSPNSPAPKQSDNTFQPRKSQIFTDGAFTIAYSLEAAGDDIILKGTISDGTCRFSYTFSKTLVGVSKDATIVISASGNGITTSFTLDFQDNNIINIQGEDMCTSSNTKTDTTTKATKTSTR